MHFPSYSQIGNRHKAICLAITIIFTLLVPCAFAQGAGYWHTSGSQIQDSNNQRVRIAAINWYGFETTDQIVHGLWAQDYHTILNQIKSNGYNTIRLPYSNQMVENPIVPTNFTQNVNGQSVNTDLVGLNALQVMDKIVQGAAAINLRIILDNHRSNAGNSAAENGLWYINGSFPESAWINDWTTLTTRYSSLRTADGNPVVIGMDLRNEPHLNAQGGATGACWTGDTSTGANGCPTSNSAQNWPAAATRAGNAIQAINPSLLIIVEGAECYNGDCDWWGGNLEGVASNPVTLNVANRLVYSPHDYGPVLFQQSWFNSSTTFASLSANWNKFWGYISANGTAPIWVGEFGTGNGATDIQNSAAGSEGQWFSSLVMFFQNNPNLSWAYWALNGEDSFALLTGQYNAVANATKQSLLATIQFPLGGGGTCATAPGAPAGVAATAISSSQINLSWNAVTPPTNCTVTYNVFRSTTSGFTPGTSNQVATGLTTPSFSNTGLTASTAYFFRVQAVDAAGSSAFSAQATATTQAAANCTSVPSAPSGVTGTATSSTQINLSWTAVTPPANCSVTYSVFRSTTSGFTPGTGNQVATGLTSPSFSNTGLTASTTYFFRVQAVDAAGASSSSAQASATTQAGGGGTGGLTVTPVVASSSGFFNEEDVKFANTSALTAMTVTIVVQRTTGINFSGQYNTVGGQITQAHTTATSTVTYTFTLNAGQSLSTGTNWTFAAQSSGTGTAHPTTGDTWTVTYTTGGQNFTQNGHF